MRVRWGEGRRRLSHAVEVPRRLRLKRRARASIMIRMRNTHIQMATGRPHSSRASRAATPDPIESLGLLIHGLAKGWREELDRRLRPLGLTRVQWQALLWLSRGGGTLVQRELSGCLDIGAPATVALVD